MNLTLEQFSAMTVLAGSTNEVLLGHADLELRAQFERALAALINIQSSRPLENYSAASVQTNDKDEVNQETSADNMDVFIQSQENNSFPEDDIWAAKELKFSKTPKKG